LIGLVNRGILQRHEPIIYGFGFPYIIPVPRSFLKKLGGGEGGGMVKGIFSEINDER
jgi:hypothetical protein